VTGAAGTVGVADTSTVFGRTVEVAGVEATVWAVGEDVEGAAGGATEGGVIDGVMSTVAYFSKMVLSSAELRVD
jgi:hypothetical protein